MLTGLFSRWFPRRALDGIVTEVFVELPVRVASPDDVPLSLVAGARAASVRWTLLYEHTPQQQGRGRRGVSHLVAFASGWRGSALRVAAACGRTVDVSLEHARLEAPIDPEDGVPLGTTPASAEEYGEAARRAPAGGGLVFVREHPITHGQSLVLRARVAPVPRSGGYRDAPAASDADFQTVGEVVVRDPVFG